MAGPTIWHWSGFILLIVFLLILDLVVLHRRDREVSLRSATQATIFWVIMGLSFNVYIYFLYDQSYQKASEYFLGYVVEKSLSMDNVFVFAVIFNYFKVPLKHQYRVLFWGILGAVVMRLTFILTGSALLQQYDWILYIFAGILIYTGIKMALMGDSEVQPERNILMRIARRIFPMTHEETGDKFFAREAGRLCITPLFLVLVVIESTDVVFAFDSVPAIFGITDDVFIIFTSNVFAILGLRALYFLLAGVMDLFQYLNYGLSTVLVFIGFKMISEKQGWVHFEHQYSLAIILGLLALSIIASVIASSRKKE